VNERSQLLHAHETLTPDDHQTHRRFLFQVPPGCVELQIRVRYEPKHLTADESTPLVEAALAQQTAELAARVGVERASQWLDDLGQQAKPNRIANLLTVSLDDAAGVYRGAGHRQSNDQRLALGLTAASPGLIAGPLPPGSWTLTISAHTLVSAQCELSIQIDAEIASSR
jgi:hypothetical protein